MDFDEYQRMALTTAMYPDQGNNLTYPALGLAGESGEICEKARDKPATAGERAALAKELGDVLWYVAMVADELGVQLSKIARWRVGIDAFQKAIVVAGDWSQEDNHDLADRGLGLAGAAGNVCDRIKKMFRDDGGTLTDTRRMAIVAGLGQVLRCVSLMVTNLDESLERVAEMNIKKLASRNRRGTITGDGDNR